MKQLAKHERFALEGGLHSRKLLLYLGEAVLDELGGITDGNIWQKIEVNRHAGELIKVIHRKGADNLFGRCHGAQRHKIGCSAGGSRGGTIATTTGTASNLVPLRAVTTTKQVVGPLAVNHFNQFTSVTINFNLLPNVAIGDATKFIEDSFAQVKQQFPTVQATFQGEALVFGQLFHSLPLL